MVTELNHENQNEAEGQQVSRIDRTQFPLFHRMAGALFQGFRRHLSSEDQLPAFLLDFFHESELERLLTGGDFCPYSR